MTHDDAIGLKETLEAARAEQGLSMGDLTDE